MAILSLWLGNLIDRSVCLFVGLSSFLVFQKRGFLESNFVRKVTSQQGALGSCHFTFVQWMCMTAVWLCKNNLEWSIEGVISLKLCVSVISFWGMIFCCKIGVAKENIDLGTTGSVIQLFVTDWLVPLSKLSLQGSGYTGKQVLLAWSHNMAI